jgi:hypothetical protein
MRGSEKTASIWRRMCANLPCISISLSPSDQPSFLPSTNTSVFLILLLLEAPSTFLTSSALDLAERRGFYDHFVRAIQQQSPSTSPLQSVSITTTTVSTVFLFVQQALTALVFAGRSVQISFIPTSFIHSFIQQLQSNKPSSCRAAKHQRQIDDRSVCRWHQIK